ncbi:ATP-dependent DNA ligase [archaeon]|jgi:DNA ligase 1|nr:ATP-dependent DNA ligase [archaeon]MBT6762691.1 ATP-dependent DNA ligase [archaeon]
MEFSKLSKLYEKLESTSSGNELRQILSDFFKETSKNNVKELPTITLLSLGKIAADYEETVLGIAEKLILKAIAKASNKGQKEITKLMQTMGDAGLVAAQVLKTKAMTLVPTGSLSTEELFKNLHKIKKIQGSGAQDSKEKILISMLQKTTGNEAKYLTRIILGNMRLGVADMTVLDALSICFTGDKSNKKRLERAYNVCPDIAKIAEQLAEYGIDKIDDIPIKVGRPIRVMLAQRVHQISDMKEKFSSDIIQVDAKYDGERVQVHKARDGEITLFSRRMENITNQFPDLVEHLQKEINVIATEYILEGEIMALSEDGKEHRHFQTLMQRKRKTEIEKYIKKVPVCLYTFDILYLNGKSLMNESILVRNKELDKILYKKNRIRRIEMLQTSNIDEVESFFQKMLKDGNEGIIAKSTAENSHYKAGARDWNWIKWKKDYMQDMVDNFDLVVIGAFYGKGKRSGNYGSLLCATYNHDNDTFESISKLGTGLNDKTLEELPFILRKHKLEKKPARVVVNKEMTPDVWFEPYLVVEVIAAEISQGKMHCAAKQKGSDRGLALRFPRFIQIRADKGPEDATTSEELLDMYQGSQ